MSQTISTTSRTWDINNPSTWPKVDKNVTVVTNKSAPFPDVTCHQYSIQTQTFLLHPAGSGQLFAAPVNATNWAKFVECSGTAPNITITDFGVGCGGWFYTDKDAPGVAKKCLDDSKLFPNGGCSGDRVWECAESPDKAEQSSIYWATRTRTPSLKLPTATATTDSVAATTSSRSAASGRPQTVGKLELAMASMMLLSLALGLMV